MSRPRVFSNSFVPANLLRFSLTKREMKGSREGESKKWKGSGRTKDTPCTAESDNARN